jgi:hypothetical protein
MTLMANNSSASMRERAPHSINSITNNTLKFNRITDDIRERARDVIQDKSFDEGSRNLIRYALEIDDPALPELVRRADAGESIADNIHALDPATEQKVRMLAEMICRDGDEAKTKSAALLVLLAALENAEHPKLLANTAKHFAFTRCGELNVCGMVDAQTALLENELSAHNSYLS